jgi:mono/diheme cytochrome c family protein
MKTAIASLALTAIAALSTQTAAANEPARAKPASAKVKRGEYLVKSVGCHDCHTPLKMGANGPEPDMTLALSGHQAQMVMPPAPKLPPGPWLVTVAATMTAWSGPWGVSYTANLTPDPDTGLGKWTERNFIETIRSGRRQGRGRALLPPMPWQVYRNLTDQDLQSIFAYLQTIPALKNRVPDPVVPPVVAGQR